MQLAYLKRIVVPENGAITLDLVEDIQNANKTSVLKARTLLSYLWDNRLLTTTFDLMQHEWKIYHRPGDEGNADLLRFQIDDVPVSVDAIMPVNYKDSTQQPGLIAIRTDPELHAILVNSFLDSSRRWLEDKPQERRVLEQAFARSA